MCLRKVGEFGLGFFFFRGCIFFLFFFMLEFRLGIYWFVVCGKVGWMLRSERILYLEGLFGVKVF